MTEEQKLQMLDTLMKNGVQIDQLIMDNHGTMNISNRGQAKQEMAETQSKADVKEALMDYVGRLMPVVAEGYREQYPKIWSEILAQDAVSSIIYNRGSQKGTVFNRNLVARISHMFVLDGIIAQGTSDVRMTELLEPEKGKNHSVRGELALMPEDKLVKKAVKEVLEKHKG